MATWSSTASKAGTYTFNTAGKYVDRNIELTIPKAAMSVSASASTSVEGSIDLDAEIQTPTKSGTTYTLTGSTSGEDNFDINASAALSTKGFTDDSSYIGTSTGTVDYAFDVDVNIPAASVEVTQGSNDLSVSANVIASGTNVLYSTVSTTKPSSGYYINVLSSVPETTINLSKTISNGYLGDDSEVSVPSTMTIGPETESKYISITGATYRELTEDDWDWYIEPSSDNDKYTFSPSTTTQWFSIGKGYTPNKLITINSVSSDTAKSVLGTGSISTSASDPGDSYTENTTAAVSSGGYLTLSNGWYPATKISLGTLIGDDIDEITSTTASDSMLSGYRAYDIDGNVLLGNIDTITLSTSTQTSLPVSTNIATINLSTSNDQYLIIPKGYNAAAGHYTIPKITSAAAPSLSITDNSSNLITPTAISGDSSKYNITTSVTGKTKYGTAGWVTTLGLAAATDSSAIIGQIAAAGSLDISPNGSGTEVSYGTASSGYYPIYNTISATCGASSAGWITTTTSTDEASIQVGKIAASTSSATVGSTLAGGSTLTIGAGYYPTDRSYNVPTASSDVGTTTATAALTLGTAPTGYTNPTLSTSKSSGSTYIELNGEITGYTTGAVLSGVTTPATKYMEVYTGGYSIS